MATVFSWVSHVPVLHVTPVAAQGKSWEGWGWVVVVVVMRCHHFNSTQESKTSSCCVSLICLGEGV